MYTEKDKLAALAWSNGHCGIEAEHIKCLSHFLREAESALAAAGERAAKYRKALVWARDQWPSNPNCACLVCEAIAITPAAKDNEK
jgi:hypothetical protein